MERITGPYSGFYVASYACETGEAAERFIGYAKICRRRPESYWDANCVVKICGEQAHDDAASALEDVESLARHHLGNLSRQADPAPA